MEISIPNPSKGNSFMKNMLVKVLKNPPQHNDTKISSNHSSIYKKLQLKIEDYATGISTKCDISKTFSNFLSLHRGISPQFSNLKTSEIIKTKNRFILTPFKRTISPNKDRKEKTQSSISFYQTRRVRKSTQSLFNFKKFFQKNENNKNKSTEIEKFSYASHIINEIYSQFKNLMNLPYETNSSIILLEKCDKLKEILIDVVIFIEERKSINKSYDDFFFKLISLIREKKNAELYLLVMLIHSKIIINSGELLKGIAILKQCKSISHEIRNHKINLKCYKRLGNAFQRLKLYNKSIIYYTKMLQMAWFVEDIDYENQAYDFIGIQYYYLQRINSAIFFHKKMFQTDDTPADKELKAISKSNILMKFNEKKKDFDNVLPLYVIMKEKEEIYSENLLNISSEDEFQYPIRNEESNEKTINRRQKLILHSDLNKKNNTPVFKIEKRQIKMKNHSLDLNHLFRQKIFLKTMTMNSNTILNHLTPNRNHEKPNIYCDKMNNLLKDENNKFKKRLAISRERHREKEIVSVESLIEKLKINCNIAIMQIDFYINKIRTKRNQEKKFRMSIETKNYSQRNSFF